MPELPAPPRIAIAPGNRVESAPTKVPDAGIALALLAPSWRPTGTPAGGGAAAPASPEGTGLAHEDGEKADVDADVPPDKTTKAPDALAVAHDALAAAREVAPRLAPERPHWVGRIGDEMLFLLVGRSRSVVDLSRVDHLHASSTKSMPNGDPVAVEGPLGQIALLGRLVGARTVVALRVDEVGADSGGLPLALDEAAPGQWRSAAEAIASSCEQTSAELKTHGEAYEAALKKGLERRESELSAWPGMLDALRAKMMGQDLRTPFVEAKDDARRHAAAFVERCTGRAAAAQAFAAALERVMAVPVDRRTSGVLERELKEALSSLNDGARDELRPLVDRMRADTAEAAAGVRELRAHMTLVDVDTAKAIAVVRAMRRGPDVERGADDLARDLVDVLAPVKPARKGKP